MTDTERQLLAAICANPDEDTPRLAYADYLDEQGQVACPDCPIDEGEEPHPADIPCARCNGGGYLPNPRAEFIRVQCEIARHPRDSETCLCGYSPRDGYHHNSPTCPYVRSDALLERHRAAWLRVPCRDCGPARKPHSNLPKCARCGDTGDEGGLAPWESGKDYPYLTVFRRGFPYRLDGCRLEDVFARYCARCKVRKATVGLCAYCDQSAADIWQPTPWALAVFRAHPTLREVPLSDVVVHPSGGNDTYYCGGVTVFPREYWGRLEGHRTAADAKRAHARAVADVIREHAKAEVPT